jgi:hypothetical protein
MSIFLYVILVLTRCKWISIFWICLSPADDNLPAPSSTLNMGGLAPDPTLFFLSNNFKITFMRRSTKSSQIATIDRPLKFKTKPRNFPILRKVQIFSWKIFVLRSHCSLAQAASNAPRFYGKTTNSLGYTNSSGSRVLSKPGPPYSSTVRAYSCTAVDLLNLVITTAVVPVHVQLYITAVVWDEILTI